ncbi:HAD family phosphatase [Nocardioides sp. SOB77]|uniref:HAD family phosphatase n=1 Tax=Nocardioides oceani TaxID=3058369 RepID=A0ABT8FKD3_9ACTN|nr:HAD family phosphatase [Nocardioides oceani]MDN4175143.1 HAD family phosphatase [Nocardioides oceani]
MATTTGPAAVLWDMDGTLVDTEPYWIETEFALAERFGGTWSEAHALSLVGNDLMVSARYIREHMPLELPPEEIVELLLDGVVERVRRSVPWCAGAREQLVALAGAGVPCALVTMSWTRFVEPILEQLPPGTFSTVVTGDHVTHGKPHPEPYLTAAERLGVDPADCLAVEDSATGASSAEAAGCEVLVVPNHVEVPPGPARTFADSLAGLDLAEVWSATRTRREGAVPGAGGY